MAVCTDPLLSTEEALINYKDGYDLIIVKKSRKNYILYYYWYNHCIRLSTDQSVIKICMIRNNKRSY
jgi:hypothetical protein